jgi:hypothetical protein
MILSPSSRRSKILALLLFMKNLASLVLLGGFLIAVSSGVRGTNSLFSFCFNGRGFGSFLKLLSASFCQVYLELLGLLKAHRANEYISFATS